nr:cation/H(+) antiporter-like protein [Fagopyrum tataricum]
MEDCVSALLMPLYFVYVGMIMRHAEFDAYSISLNTTLVVVAVLAKPLCIFIVSIICGVPFRDGLAISVLLNAKGLLSVVIATVGFERGHLSSEAVAVLVSIVVVSSMVVEPVMMFAYNRVMKNTKPYDNRTIGGLKPEAEFRVISCIQGPRNLSSTINLLEISNVTHIFALHLTELIGRTSAMLIVHESNKDSGGNGFYNRARAQSDQIITAFDNYQRQHSDSTAVQTLTIVSPMETMHEDICHLAEDKQVNMIMLPFHKQQGMDGNLEDDKNIEIRSVNQNVMAGAPCSISLLIDRGIGMLSGPRPSFSATRSNNQSECQEGEVRVAMFYFGGPDDREALSYAGRLASNTNVTLTLIRIVVGSNPVDVEPIIFPGDEEDEEENGIPTVYTEQKHEKDIDNNFIANFLQRNSAESPVQYMEMASNSGADTVAMLKEIDHRNFDLYMVGRGQGVLTPMTSGLIEWSECPELGPIGDVLVTSDFAVDVSVLVVQQYAGARLTSPEDAAVIDF